MPKRVMNKSCDDIRQIHTVRILCTCVFQPKFMLLVDISSRQQVTPRLRHAIRWKVVSESPSVQTVFVGVHTATYRQFLSYSCTFLCIFQWCLRPTTTEKNNRDAKSSRVQQNYVNVASSTINVKKFYRVPASKLYTSLCYTVSSPHPFAFLAVADEYLPRFCPRQSIRLAVLHAVFGV